MLRQGAVITTSMVVLTFIVGLVEAVSFLALDTFTAIQTGNLLLLSFALAGSGHDLSAASSLASLLGFAIGVISGSRFHSRDEVLRAHWFVAALYVEAALLCVGGLVLWHMEDLADNPPALYYLATGFTALGMGLRNVTAMRVNVPDVPTTLVTRPMTALLGGVFLGPERRPRKGEGHTRRRSASVCSMFFGGLVGAYLLHVDIRPSITLMLAAALSLVVALGFPYATRRWAP